MRLILTIHKSKGLQFKVVMIPFCDWNLDHENMKQPTLWVKSEEPEFQPQDFCQSTIHPRWRIPIFNLSIRKNLCARMSII